MSFFNDYILPHWPFIAFVLIAGMVTQTFKALVWTETKAKEGRMKWFFLLGRRTLPLHPSISGALIGLIPGLPMSEGMDHTMAAASLYYGAAGIIAAYSFDIIKALAKKRDIEIPSLEEVIQPRTRDTIPTPPETPIPKMSRPPDMEP